MTRQGIPRLAPNEDPVVLFREIGDASLPRDALAPPSAAKRREGGRRTDQPPDQRRAKARARNRHGIRKLDPQFDLGAHFKAQAPPHLANESRTGVDPHPHSWTRRPPRLDRHGIPQLDQDTDLRQHFAAAAPPEDAGEALAELLRQSLADGPQATMKRKTGGVFPTRQLSLKETLRRYPNPQAQLDLHGLTARQAQLRVDRFVRTTRANGLYTLRIIVGKGLHSEAGAVLPDVVEDLLVDLKRQGLILAFAWDRRAKKKSGAVLVFLTTEKT